MEDRMRPTREEIEREALQRAEQGQSFSNYPAIYAGLAEKGIAEDDIDPRVNVLTFHAWKAKGRSVKKGEHGVRVVTYVNLPPKVNERGETERPALRRMKTAHVFHISQTEERTR
jgi:hypothetical protein